MAVAINSLKYIPDLPAASSAAGVDLLHLSQGGNDKQLTITNLLTFLNDKARPVGSLFFTGQKGKDPNTLFPGQTWVRYGAGRSLRVCLDDESNLGAGIGSDTINLTVAQLPVHAHAAGTLVANSGGAHAHNGSTSGVGDHTHAAWTDAQGNHNHAGRYVRSNTSLNGGTSNRLTWEIIAGYNNDSDLIGYAGLHGHNIGMNGAGAHSHTFTTNTTGAHTHSVSGSVANTGSGSAVTVVPLTIHVGCWIRTV
jgi:microcystin-dependent protein